MLMLGVKWTIVQEYLVRLFTIQNSGPTQYWDTLHSNLSKARVKVYVNIQFGTDLCQ